MTRSERRLVVLRALGLGDFLTGLPALRALADAFPHHERVLAAPAVLAGLARLSGAVDAVVDTPGLVNLSPGLAAPDIAVDLHGRGPGSQPLLLALQPRRLVAFEHSAIPETVGMPRWRPDEHEVHRWCRLLAEQGIAADPRRLDLTATLAAAHPSAAGATLLHPGAAFPARRWPATRFAAVGRELLSQGDRVVVSAGPGEEGLARAVAAGVHPTPGVVPLIAGLTLEELAATVAVAERLVCGDTGIAHLATAVRTPSVVLFGPVPPCEWGPPPERPWHRALWAGRRGDPHGAALDPGLDRISVGDVLTAVFDLPRAAGSGHRAVAAASVR